MSIKDQTAILRDLLEGVYDQAVKDPDLLPKALTKRYKQGLKKLKITVNSSEATMPRGWDYGNVTKITTKDGDQLTMVLHVDNQEASGFVTVNKSTIATKRGKPQEVVNGMIADLLAFLQ